MSKMFLAAVAMSFLVSCGDKSDKGTDKDGDALNVLSATGEWTSNCVPNDTPIADKDLYVIHKIKYKGNSYTDSITAYYSEDCSHSEDLRLERKGTYRLENKTLSLLGDEEVVFDYDDFALAYSLTPLSPSREASLNLGAVCDRTGWKTGKPFAVTGRTCWGKKLFSSSATYTILLQRKVGGDSRVFLGLLTPEYDGSSKEKRARLINENLYFR